MKKRIKYALNGVYRCEDFAQHTENGDFPIFRIGRDAWFIQFFTMNGSEEAYVLPYIADLLQLNYHVRFYFNVLKKDGSSAFETECGSIYLKSRDCCPGAAMNLEELLNEGNGYLDDGALTIEYGLQVESVKVDGIWIFNLFDPLFASKNQDNMLTFIFTHSVPIHCHKQLVELHSSIISRSGRYCQRLKCSIPRQILDMCLQIVHGVRLQSTAKENRNVARVAFRLGFFNALRYCEQQLIEMDEQSMPENFKFAVSFNMRCYLNFLLKQIETKEQMVKILSGLNLEKMSSESMKAIVAKIFSF